MTGQHRINLADKASDEIIAQHGEELA